MGALFVCPNTYPHPMTDDPRDANGYRYADYPASRGAVEQKILNESWPLRDGNQRHARGVDDRPVDEHRLVTARLVFEHDGETYLPGRATRWTDLPADRAHAFVIVDDPRVRRGMVWVRFRDIRPRT